ncbi:hypothetical protein [Novosphingobium humi]|uniref:PLD phosphodiesterase domain-containing protein n=1 Tax=Novosphingobium humi TaxID=2282397 RepID=A0ABY7U446_9SPHN|nr:hypothetical protein [Novosphingobium humi]WCT80091.1 hypothetical protein PQ457_18715 [Novosphingobium humi]
MTVDFLDFLKGTRGKFAFVATYEFDPLFFERRVLPTSAFEGAMVTVFVDRERYQQILADGRQGAGFDRDYFVIPVRRESGVFHPKLYLAIGDKGAIASVGSNNCTPAGTGHNFELISTLAGGDATDRHPASHLIATLFREFERYSRDAGPVEPWLRREIFGHARVLYPWLGDASGADASEIDFLSSHDGPIWPMILSRLDGVEVKGVTLMAPFFDLNLRAVQRVRERWPDAPIKIISQSGYSNLPIERFLRLSETLGSMELLTATPHKAGRNVHAKALAFETPDCTYWLAGSANMSHAALSGGNSEACLWFATKQTFARALKQDGLKFESIPPEDFKPAPIEEPAAESAAGRLRLDSLILDNQGTLLANVSIPDDAQDAVLRIFKRNEVLPTFSWKISGPRADFAISLDDDDWSKFDGPAIGRLHAVIDGREVSSGYCSVQQLSRLLRERAAGNAAGNRYQRAMDSGDGLIEYVDALDGIDAAIDFMNTATMRFIDGAPSGGGAGKPHWRARDPFSGDIPEHWQLGSSGGSLLELREAIWGFVQRHIDRRLYRHARRGNLGGLANYLDIFRTMCRVLLAWHNRRLEGEPVIPAAYVTTGLQAILSTLIGARGEALDEAPGLGRAILANLSADEKLVREQLQHFRIPAVLRATVEEMTLVRAVAQRRPALDSWSKDKHRWIDNWIDEMGLAAASEAEMQEISPEFRLAA